MKRLLSPARVGVLATCAVASAACYADSRCTPETPDRKLPSALRTLVTQIDGGSFKSNLCKVWAGAEPIAEAKWTVFFKPGVLKCAAGKCRPLQSGKVRIHVVSAASGVEASVRLTPDRIEPLLEDERVRYIVPACSALPEVSTSKDSDYEWQGAASPPNAFPAAEAECQRDDAPQQWGMSDACIPAAVRHDVAPKVIAVLDSGLHCLHPAIQGRINGVDPMSPRGCTADSGKNYVYPQLPPDNCNEDSEACSGHGTAVAGVIASAAADLPGADPSARLNSVRVLNDIGRYVRPWQTVKSAIRESAQYGQIINISSNWYTDYPFLAEAIDDLTADGNHLVVTAARDEGWPAVYPAEFTKCNDAVIAVSDIGWDAESSRYEWGRTAAQNEAFMVAPGTGIRVLRANSTAQNPYTWKNGSSFAAPLVAGAAALVWSTSEFASCKAAGIRKVLECSARDSEIGIAKDKRKRLHLGCLFAQRDSPSCAEQRDCIERAKDKFCR
jgi:hypothetical protein